MPHDESAHDPKAEELEDAHKHADPAKSGTRVDGGDRANVTPVDQGRGVAEADKKL